jgi:hypothetical protein
METFIGQVSWGPERRDGRWHFSLYDEESSEQLQCMSSMKFETAYSNIMLDLKPHETVTVFGSRRYLAQFWFDEVSRGDQSNLSTSES